MKLFLVIISSLLLFCAYAQDEPKVSFEPIGGIYDSSQTVVITAPENAAIFYTTDGSRPNSGSTRYKNPILVETVAVIRAVAYVDGKRTGIVTQSYFCDRPYTLPVVSITTNPENLWDYSAGIYVKGCCADTIEPYMGANFWKDWEKYANIEMYETNGDLCFNQEVGINVFGGFSRMLPQKSLAVFARKKYGNNRIEYPIFPERDINKYKSFIIRNSGGDFKRTHFRDAFMTQLAKPTGLAIQAYRPIILFLNGKYWGIQNLREKISEHYLKANFDVDKDNVDILRHNGVARHGTSKRYKQLLAYLRTKDMTDDAVIEKLRTFMDVDDYIRYNIAETYSDNRDAGGNIRYWRERTDSAQWRWVFYDLDLGMGNNQPSGYKHNTVKKFTSANAEAWPDPAWSTFIIRSLLKNEKLQIQYINTFADHLNTVYKTETALDLIDRIQDPLRTEMEYHGKRWGQSYENWEYHVDIVRKFVTERPKYLRQYIMEKFELEDTIHIQIDYDEAIEKMNFNSLMIEESFEGVYFKDVPVTIAVQPRHDYNFIGWEGRPDTAMTLEVVPSGDLVLKPLFEPKDRSVFSDSILFNELCVFQVPEDTSKDWVELYNGSQKEINLSNWVFSKNSYKKGFKFPDNITLGSNEYLILIQDSANYETVYNLDTVNVLGNFDFGLSKENGLLKLYDEKGLIVDSLRYQYDEWDTTVSVSLVHPDSSRNDVNNWIYENPNPGEKSGAYRAYLKEEADKKYWTKLYYISGGSFFFILVGGLLLRRFYKRKKRKSEE